MSKKPRFYKVQDSAEVFYIKLRECENILKQMKNTFQNPGVLTGKELNTFFNSFEDVRSKLDSIEHEATSYFKRNEINEDVVPIFMEQIEQRYNPKHQVIPTDISLSSSEDDDLPF